MELSLESIQNYSKIIKKVDTNVAIQMYGCYCYIYWFQQTSKFLRRSAHCSDSWCPCGACTREHTHTHTHTGGQLPCASQYATSGGQMPTALAHLKAFCRGDLLFLASVPSVWFHSVACACLSLQSTCWPPGIPAEKLHFFTQGLTETL